MALLARALVLLVVLGFSGGAAADLRVFQATLSLDGLNPPAPPIATGVGVATVNGAGTSAHINSLALPAGFVAAQTSVPLTPTPSFPATAVRLTVSNAAGMFVTGGAGFLGGPMRLPGNAQLCALGSCTLHVEAPLTQGGTRGIGIGGTVMGAGGPFGALTQGGGLWNTGMVGIPTSVGVVTRAGFAHGPLSGTSSTAAPQGRLQLVTPIAVKLSLEPGLVNPVFGVLDVKCLPEPAIGVLFGSGGVLLLLMGRTRTRRVSQRSR
jgi:hypothetical protein